MDNRETIGKISRDLILKDIKSTHSIKEQGDAQLSDYEKNVYKCIEDNKHVIANDFYVVVLTKKEKLMQNVIRNYFYVRLSCPTPNYDQIVYKYHKKDERIEFLWVIPDREISKHMKKEAASTPPDQWELLSYVLKFADGSLYKLAKDLNGEEDNTIILKDKHGN